MNRPTRITPLKPATHTGVYWLIGGIVIVVIVLIVLLVGKKKTPSCKPDCAGKACGDDGCGGKCGSCTPPYHCIDDTCVSDCTPAAGCPASGVALCQTNQCGDDGCCGSCGSCTLPQVCMNGQCVDAIDTYTANGITWNLAGILCDFDGSMEPVELLSTEHPPVAKGTHCLYAAQTANAEKHEALLTATHGAPGVTGAPVECPSYAALFAAINGQGKSVTCSG